MKTLKMFVFTLIILIVPRDLYAATVGQYTAKPVPSFQYSNGYGTYQVVCSPDQYRCSSGLLCINASSRCNGIPECPSGDDEQNCPAPSSTTTSSIPAKKPDAPADCAPAMFYQCEQSKRCIPWSQLCDGNIQCLFGDDENQANCKHVPGFAQQQPETVKQSQLEPHANPISNETNVTEPPTYQPTTFDYANQGNYSNGNYSSGAGATEVKVDKVVQSSDRADNRFYQDKDGSGFVFVNFGPIINGDKNVNGNGNDLGNGNANGNENGNANGNGNGNENGNGNNNNYQRLRPFGEDYKTYYNEGKGYYA